MRLVQNFLALVAVLTATILATASSAIDIRSALVTVGVGTISGRQAQRDVPMLWEGVIVAQSRSNGAFDIATTLLPSDCVGTLSDGVDTIDVVVANCGPRGARSSRPSRWALGLRVHYPDLHPLM